MKELVLVTYLLDEIQKQAYLKAFPDLDIQFISSKNATLEDIQNATVIIGNPRTGHLKNVTKLKWLQLESAGYERYTANGVLPESVILTNGTGAYGPAVAEHMLALLLSLYKKLPLYRDLQKQGLWQDQGNVKGIQNSKILVVGTGDIGSHFAQMVKSLGAEVIGIRRQTHLVPTGFDKCHSLSEIDELIPQMDAIILCIPSEKETYQLMNKHRLSLMKEGAVLINGGRGNALDTQALVQVLESGKDIWAGLEVTDPEPLPEQHPLWKNERVIITPHVAGGNHLPLTFEKLTAICLENLQRYLEKKELKNVVKR